MGFSQDLKDFVSNFEKGYKVATPSTADAYLHKMAADEQQKAIDSSVYRGGASDAYTEGGGPAIKITSGLTPGGKLPTFARADMSSSDLIPAVIAAETNRPEEMKDVAAVIANRANAAKVDPSVVVTAPKQFEAYTNASYRNVDPNTLAKARQIWQDFAAGKIPDATGGATHYYAPVAQKALGRPPPSWDDGTGVDRGRHRFFNLGYSLPGRRAAIDLEEPTAFAAEGGLIPEPRYSGFDDSAGSNPVVRDITEGQPDPKQFIDPNSTRAAMDAGMKYIQRKLGLDNSAIAEASPNTSEAAQALAHNVGAPAPQQVNQLMDTVDPSGELPTAQRAIAGWNALFQYKMAQGDPEGAARASAAMLMHSKAVSTRAGVMALAALDKGDTATAVKAIQAAYDHFPDGKSLKAEVGPGGVKYEVVDQDGRGLNGGTMTEQQLKSLAQGMVDGTQWFQAVQAARTPVNPAAQKAENERKAIEDFESARIPNEKDFIATLDPEEKAAFLKMPRSAQLQYRKEHQQRLEQERKQGNFDTRRGDLLENRDYQRDWNAFKTALAQNNWETKRQDVLTKDEIAQAQRQQDLDDRNTRRQLSADERKERNRQIDERILQQRAARGTGTGTGGGAIKLTAKEAAAQREEQAATSVDRMRQQDRAAAVLGDTEDTDISEGQRGAIDLTRDAARANAGFRSGKPTDFSDEDAQAIQDKLKEQWPIGTGKTDPRQADHEWASQIAMDIRRGGNFTTDQALRFTLRALNPTAPEPRVTRDGRVVIDPKLPPVRMSDESLIALAQMRARMTREDKPTKSGRSETATPGASAPTGRGVLPVTSGFDLNAPYP